MSFKSTVTAAVTEKGYALAAGADVAEQVMSDWQGWAEFAAFWEDLGDDNYLQGDYMFRTRRYGQVGLIPRTGKIWRREHTPYFQSAEINSYAGGIVREFAPLTEEIVGNEIFQNMVRDTFDLAGIEDEFRDAEWFLEVSLFRLKVEGSRVTEPTPEGIHRDGVPFGVIHLVDRQGIEGGVSHVYTPEKELLDVGVLKEPLDTLYAYDNRVMHYVTPIYSCTVGEGYRDVLIYGFHLPNTKYQQG